ncbi:unnamed protein product [Cylicostephanus goldi]|uniref:G-protein coupled receptors family 1 profile domain-containing protein n=1 Tax=Cylicostephanus goldi TaxID=71465 RepID=A0A3P6RYY6_CYLGO|nr:unnamed protein product [Cylicostephanus goldi]
MILLYDFFWYAEVVHFALMAFNRFVCIAYPAHYSTLFSKTCTAYIICCCYLLGLVISLPVLIPCCYILWDSYDYITFYSEPHSW